MKLVPRGSVWSVHFTDNAGIRQRVSTGERDEALARIKAVEIMREKLIDDLPRERRPAGITVTIAGALSTAYEKVWKSQKGAKEKRYTIGKIAREIGHWPLTGVTFDRLQDWADAAIEAGRSPATMNRHLAAVHTALTLAHRREKFELPEFPHYAENNIKERYLTDAEERMVLQWFVDNTATANVELVYLRRLFVTLLDTGMRAGEATTLGPFNLRRNAAGELVDIWLPHGSTKNGRGRLVPLTDRARVSAVALVTHPLHRGEFRGAKVDSNWASRRWGKLATKMGIPDVGLHTLRHTCASRLVQAGVALYVVKEWLGHSSIKITERYAHLAPGQFDDALRALQGRAEVGVDRSVSRTPGMIPNVELHPSKNGTDLCHSSSLISNLDGAPGEIRSCSPPGESMGYQRHK